MKMLCRFGSIKNIFFALVLSMLVSNILAADSDNSSTPNNAVAADVDTSSTHLLEDYLILTTGDLKLVELELLIVTASNDEEKPTILADISTVKRMENLHILRVALTSDAVAYLRLNPNIIAIEKDTFISIHKSLLVAGKTVQLAASWNLDRIDQINLPLDTFYTSRSDKQGENVDIYILDSGINAAHSDFGGRVDLSLSRSFFEKESSTNVEDENGHGTFVSSLAIGESFGVAKKARVVALKIYGKENSGPVSSAILAVEYILPLIQARAQASPPRRSVINLSWGGDKSLIVDNCVRRLSKAGAVVVAAAGNDRGSDACNFSPSGASDAICVAAIDPFGDRFATYSNSGSCVDILAPGTMTVGASKDSGEGSIQMSGTSMSSPLVAGAAAIYLSTFQDASPARVKAGLVCSSPNKAKGVPEDTTTKILHIPPGGFSNDKCSQGSGLVELDELNIHIAEFVVLSIASLLTVLAWAY
jgi:subtilisin family serine protease